MRAIIEEDDFGERADGRNGKSRVAPNFRAYGRPPTIEEAALYCPRTDLFVEDRASSDSLQCSQITIGIGKIKRLGRKKREQFLSVELGLDALVEAYELEEAQLQQENDDPVELGGDDLDDGDLDRDDEDDGEEQYLLTEPPYFDDDWGMN